MRLQGVKTLQVEKCVQIGGAGGVAGADGDEIRLRRLQDCGMPIQHVGQ